MVWHRLTVLWNMAITAVLLATIQHSHCIGTLSVSIHYWVYAEVKDCDMGMTDRLSGRYKCDPRLEIFLTRVNEGDVFQHKQGQNEYVENQNTVPFKDMVAGVRNPIQVKLPQNTGKVTLKITVFDWDGSGSYETLTNFKADLKTIRNSGAVGLYHDGIKYSYSFTCEPEDTDELCTVQCKAHDDPREGHYTCDSGGQKVCMSGWMGSDCKVELPCGVGQASSPCQNNGKCEVLGATTFTCHCMDGYWGTRCEKYFKPCLASPCKNGGNCKADTVNNDFTCECRAGLIGTFCETDQMRCTSDLCQNGGTCIEFIGGFSCTCAAGFTGEKCNIDIDECTLRPPCVNGGTCVNTPGGFKCLCPGGLSGDWCQVDVNECETPSFRCRADQICVNTPGSYACVVVDRDDCDGVECAHGGTCVDREFHYVCLCLPGYTGPTCSVSSHHTLVENL